MVDDYWKHLPFAIYLDTNAVREAGIALDAPWINALLSITNNYGISVCISDLVLAEWERFVICQLDATRRKVFSSLDTLAKYDIHAPNVQSGDLNLPERKRFKEMLVAKLGDIGIDVIPNCDIPLSTLLAEAVEKKPPFEEGGKGLCDAVILESFAKHASENYKPQSRVIVVSRDAAVRQSGERFSSREVAVDFVDAQHAVEKVKSLLDDEVRALIETEREKLFSYIKSRESEVLDFASKARLRITDSMLHFVYRVEDRIDGTVESIVSVKPLRVTDVIGGTRTYGEEPQSGRYPLRISVELEITVIARVYSCGYEEFAATRAVVEPCTLNGDSPVSLPRTMPDVAGRQVKQTVRRTMTVLASVDATKQAEGILDDLALEEVA